MIRTPTLSVTVLNYNYARYLEVCLGSLLRQTFRDFEVLLVNDASTDNSREVIAAYRDDPRLRFVDHTHNQGYVRSLLEGCELSRGKYVTVISADDYALDDRAFERVVGTLEADDEIVFCYSAWHQVDDEGRVNHTRRGGSADYVHSGSDELRRLLLASPILHSGTVIRRSAYDAVGGYDRRCRYSVDTNMWLALCSVGKVAYVDAPLFAYRAHATNLSNSSGALWRATEEMLLGVDTALARFPDGELPDKERLRRQAYQRALVAVPTLDVFSGRYRRGWHGYLQAAQRYPALTVVQPRTASLALRTLLGQQTFERLRALTGRRDI